MRVKGAKKVSVNKKVKPGQVQKSSPSPGFGERHIGVDGRQGPRSQLFRARKFKVPPLLHCSRKLATATLLVFGVFGGGYLPVPTYPAGARYLSR